MPQSTLHRISKPRPKVRFGPDGIHLFFRDSGANILIEEVIPARSEWTIAPRQVSIALTNACDLSCPHCYAPKTHAMLPFDRLISWLDELDANGTVGVGFGGGEPTLFGRFAELCAHAVRNTTLAVTFTTHGHHLSAKLLAQLEGNVHFVRVSMDGVHETYERLRRRPFDTLLERLFALRQLSPFGINFVVNAFTIPDIDLAAEYAQKCGASEFLLLPEQATKGCVGIDHDTLSRLKAWVKRYSGSMRLAISENAADEIATSNPFELEKGLLAYAHINAQGFLKLDSFALEGVPIDETGVLAALNKLRIKQHNTK